MLLNPLEACDLASADVATEALDASLTSSSNSVQQLQEQVGVLLTQLNVAEAARSSDTKALSEQLATANASLATSEATTR